jgi:hypothetical protein
MGVMLSEAFIAVLRARRPELNAQFAQARHRSNALAGEPFSQFLIEAVDPLVQAVEKCAPERVEEVALCAYEIGLELVGQRLAGRAARRPELNEGWRDLLPRIAPLVAREPRRVLASVSNALLTLSNTAGARAGWWCEEMARLAPLTPEAEVFLPVGQVMAWRAGLAHFRLGALAIAEALPESLALAVMGVAAGAGWNKIRARLERDPWYRPDGAGSGVVRVGAFRGFGGLFPEPPRVAVVGGELLVRSGEACWLLIADAFGATFHRTALPAWPKVPSEASMTNHWPADAKLRGPVTGFGATPVTLAATSSLTYAITLVPRPQA